MGVILMGDDRVFIRGSNNENVWEVYNLAKDFFWDVPIGCAKMVFEEVTV